MAQQDQDSDLEFWSHYPEFRLHTALPPASPPSLNQPSRCSLLELGKGGDGGGQKVKRIEHSWAGPKGVLPW